MHFQSIYDIAQVCSLKGIGEAVLCPGSRCAPLTLAFARHPQINCRTISDERSAAFIALGIAQSTRKPVVLISTSGSAVYNFAPAIAEAFFQQIPLIVLSADRPKEWINQLDGQTIQQSNIYGNHVKQSWELPQDYNHSDTDWYINRTINEAINLCSQFPAGPVHLNVPLREPLYPKDKDIQYSGNVRTINRLEIKSVPVMPSALLKGLSTHKKILLVAGQHQNDQGLGQSLDFFSKKHFIPVVGDITSNLHSISNFIQHNDLFLSEGGAEIKESLRADLLITFGNSVLSKSLKQFLRTYNPKEHWHIQEAGTAADTFQHLTTIVPVSPAVFFETIKNLLESSPSDHKRENYLQLWQAQSSQTAQNIQLRLSKSKLTHLSFVQLILSHMPQSSALHLANSMSVRYANFIGLNENDKTVEVFCNRGTSGIDGCISTGMGHTLSSDQPNIIVTGDMALFYDRNAFWHNYKYPNLRIVVLNDHGGGIFNLIDGPQELPELQEYFITNQKLNASNLAAEFGITYLKLDSASKVKNILQDFFEFDGKPKLLELEIDSSVNREEYVQFKEGIRKGYQ